MRILQSCLWIICALALGATARAQVMPVSSTSATGLNVALYSSASRYTFYPGSPAIWGDLQENGYVEYALSAGAGGTYSLQLYYSNGTPTSGTATILVSGDAQAPASLASTGGWSNFQLDTASTVTLPAGRSILRIAAGSPVQAFNLAGILLTPLATAAAQVPAAGNPLFGMKFFVNSYSAAGQNSWQGCSNGQSIGKIAAQAQSTWFGNWNWNPAGDVATVMQSAAASGTVPILTVYNIVNRDCGGYSSGGAANAGAYRDWIDAFASGIGSGQAVIVLEPDSLTQYNTQGCLNQGQQSERLSLLQYAISSLKQNAPNAVVYLDGGPPNGINAAQMAKALTGAGVSQAAGFAVNVSNYESLQSNVDYGNKISRFTGGKHYVVDTSRNGVGATWDHQWCNPANRGLGLPSQGMASGLLDGYLWVQNPGTSDGTCNGGPPAGQFSEPIACTLLQNSAF